MSGKVLLEFEDGARLEECDGGVKFVGLRPLPIQIPLDIELSGKLLEIIARRWMDVRGIKYDVVQINFKVPEEPQT